MTNAIAERKFQEIWWPSYIGIPKIKGFFLWLVVWNLLYKRIVFKSHTLTFTNHFICGKRKKKITFCSGLLGGSFLSPKWAEGEGS